MMIRVIMQWFPSHAKIDFLASAMRKHQNMLLIYHLSQLLDAFNNCSLGLFSYEDVIRSAQVPAEELHEFLPEAWSATPVKVHDNPDYRLDLLMVSPADTIEVARQYQQEFVYTVSGQIMLNGTTLAAGSGAVIPHGSAQIRGSGERSLVLHLRVKG